MREGARRVKSHGLNAAFIALPYTVRDATEGRMQQDGMRKVRADLCERIDGLQASVSYAPTIGLCAKASDVRHLAQQYALRPVADLAWKLEGRLARGERGPSVIETLHLMREATESGRTDAQAAGQWSAVASVRMM